MPSRRDIDPLEIPALLPIVFLADFYATEPRIRLMGTEAAEAYGSEPRGQRVGQLDLGDFTDIWIQAFALVIATSAPVGAAGTYSQNGRSLSAQSVLTPLSHDGTTIDHVFGGLLITPVPFIRSIRNSEAKSCVRPVGRRSFAMGERREA